MEGREGELVFSALLFLLLSRETAQRLIEHALLLLGWLYSVEKDE